MRNTIYDSAIAKALLRPLSRGILKLAGWRKEGDIGQLEQAVVIGAPHTSNWDFVLAVLYAFDFGFTMFWMGKDSLFAWPVRPFMLWLGGIPIDRSRSHNIVENSVNELKEGRISYLVVPPEGTRGQTSRWKTGFYYIALGAEVPIALGFLDFKRKVGGFGPHFNPTGDMERDMESIRDFYKGITAKYPEKANHG